MRNRHEPFPLVLNRIIVFQIQIGFSIFNAVLPEHFFQSSGNGDADSPVSPGGIDADQSEVDDLRMPDCF